MSTFSAVVDQAMEKLGSSNSLKSQQKSQDEGTIIRIGDQISMSIDMDDGEFGYMSTDGIVNPKCSVEVVKKQVPFNFKDCIFVVHNVNQYTVSKQYNKLTEEQGIKDYEKLKQKIATNKIKNAQKPKTKEEEVFEQLEELRKLMESERKANATEMKRVSGRDLLYGQAIQILHVKSNKFLSVARESAELQKDCMKLVLDEHGSTSSYFHVMPYYRFKREGEKVRYGDQIRLWNRKYNQYLHASSSLSSEFVPVREANMSTASQNISWRLKLYSPYIANKDMRFLLKAGDVVRIYHRELESYLSSVDDNKTKFDLLQSLKGGKRYRREGSMMGKPKPSEGSKVVLAQASDEQKKSSNTLWEVEFIDRSRGGVATFDGGYRLKNLATGKYLTITYEDFEQEQKEHSSDDSSSSSDDDDDAVVIEKPVLSQEFVAEPKTPVPPTEEETKKDAKASLRSAIKKLALKKTDTADSKDNTPVPEDTPRSSNEPKKLSFTLPLDKLKIVTPTTATTTTTATKNAANEGMDASDVSTPRQKSKWQFLKTNMTKLQPDQASDTASLDSPKSDTSDRERGFLFLSEEESENSVFTLQSTSKLSGDINYDSNLRIYHEDSGCWVHGMARTKVNLSKSLANLKSAPLTQPAFDVEVNSQLYEEDIYVLVTVDKEEWQDVFKIQSTIPQLKAFINKISQLQPLKYSDCPPLEEALTQLIYFCTKSDETDALKREGIPYESRQRLLRERRVIDMVMCILYLPFHKNYIKPSQIRFPEYKHFDKIFKLAYRLIRQICKLNQANGLYMSSYMKIMQEQLDYDIFAEDALLEILSYNVELLTNISVDEVKFFVNLLSFTTYNSPRHLEFLSALCTCEDKAIVKNQDLIVDLLFDPERNLIENLYIPVMKDKLVYVKHGSDQTEIAKFCGQPNHSTLLKDRIVDYLQQAVYLFARLCANRNEKAIKIVRSILSYDLVLHCIQSTNLTYKVRRSFCNVLMNVYINVPPYSKMDLLLVTRKWTDIGVPETAKTDNPFKDLKAFLRRYFLSSDQIEISLTDQNRFLLSLVRLCRTLLQFHLFVDTGDANRVIEPLYKMLDGMTDTIKGKRMADEIRYAESEENIIVMKIKHEVCKIFSMKLDYRLNQWVTQYLTMYKTQYLKNGSVDKETEQRALRTLFNDRLENQFDDIDRVLLDLTHYENLPLATYALHLLFRAHSMQEEFANTLLKVEVIVSHAMASSYDSLRKIREQIEQLLRSPRLDEKDSKAATQLLREVMLDIKKNGSRSQRILRNLQLHTSVLQSLKGTIKRSSMRHMHIYAVQFLTSFVKDNDINQRLLFQHMDFLLSMLSTTKIDDITILLYEIIKNNYDLASNIEERHIRVYVDIIAETGRKASYLMFLRALIIVKGAPLKRNQTIITKNMIDRAIDVLVLFNDEENIRERNRLIKKGDHLVNPDGNLSYHINMLNLLCDCADGKNHVTEVKLQSLLSLPQLVDQLTDPETISEVRDPLLKFLDEVYITTEKHNADTTDQVYDLFVQFNNELAVFLHETSLHQVAPTRRSGRYSLFRKDVPKRKVSLTPVHKTASLEDRTAYVIDNHYVFKLMIPIVRNYFLRQFPNSGLQPDKRQLFDEIIQRIIKLHDKVANPYERQAVLNCMEAASKVKLMDETKSRVQAFVNESSGKFGVIMEVSQKATIIKVDEDESVYRNFSAYARHVAQHVISGADLTQVTKRYKQSMDAEKGKPNDMRTLVQTLLKLSQQGFRTAETITITLKALRMIQQLITTYDGMQKQLSQIGVTNLFLELCCAPVDSIVEAALDLGIKMLDKGNQAVQQSIYDIFHQTADSFSGSVRDRFFSCIRERIRISISEIKDRRTQNRQKREKIQAKKERRRQKLIRGYKKATEEELDEEEMIITFKEKGFICKVLRVLQLMCEGHNLKLQSYLNYQENASVNVDLVHDAFHYLQQLYKHTDHSTIEITMQCFDTLTEFVQGPCRLNQLELTTPEMTFMVNEILSQSYEGSLKFQDDLKLKSKVITNLISLLEGADAQQIFEILRSSLEFKNILHLIKESVQVNTSKDNEMVQKRLRADFLEPELYPEEVDVKAELAGMTDNIRKRYYKLGINCFFLARTIEDNEAMLPKKERLFGIALHKLKSEISLDMFTKNTGHVEVLRDNKLEKLYYRIPETCTYLSGETMNRFEKEVPRSSSQEKVQILHKRTDKFRIEMEHHSLKKDQPYILRQIWPFMQRYWRTIKIGSFFFSLLINIITLFTFKKVVDANQHDIPIPGVTGFSDVKQQLTGDFAYDVVSIVLLALGLLQCVIVVLLLGTYMLFFSSLYVKKQFDLSKKKKWEEEERNYSFYWKYVKHFFKDYYFWFMIWYLVISILGLTVSPLIYSLHLFEVISYFGTLKNVLKAIFDNIDALAITGLLMLITIFFFSMIMFNILYDSYVLQNEKERLCPSAIKCFASMINYGLRAEGFMENIIFSSLSWKRFFVDLSFFAIVAVVLVEIVFGIILDAFEERRVKNEENKELQRTKCFICDIEKSRFDMKANEGISFKEHVERDHFIWNYVFFLIYIYAKDPTKFTGTEQYVAKLALSDDLSFFPILRSLVLEQAEQKEIKQNAMKSKNGEDADDDSSLHEHDDDHKVEAK